MALLIKSADIGAGRLVDICAQDGVIAAIHAGERHHGDASEVVDAAGGLVLPGFHDHHLHLRSLAAALESVRAGPPEVRTVDELARQLRVASRGRAAGSWLRAVGYHESVAGALDRWSIDRLVADRPVRVEHRSGILWILNSAALDALAIEHEAPAGVERDTRGNATGRLWRCDRWLAAHLPQAQHDIAAAARKAASVGVTGCTEATPDQSLEALTELVTLSEQHRIPQRLHLMAPLGIAPPPAPLVSLGPVKVMLDDHSLPSLNDLCVLVREAHATGRTVAMHCVTRVQTVLAILALQLAGCARGDRIEHAAVIGEEQVLELARLGVTVVSQPGLAVERGDQYLAELPRSDHRDLWRVGSLLRAGVRLGLSSDAPYGPLDPWVVIRAAVTRRTPGGAVLGRDEGISSSSARRLYSGSGSSTSRVRRVRPGQPADLVVCARSPMNGGESSLGQGITATIVAGRVVYRAEEAS